MRPISNRITAAVLLAALVLVGTQTVRVAAQVPDVLAVPDPAAVLLDPNTTAFIAVDFLQSTCAPNPTCVNALPAIASGLTSARSANALVIYSVHPAPDDVIMSDIAPLPDDPVFTAVPGDKFFNSDLDQILNESGRTTVVLSGISSNSGIMYTAAAAIQRGYTVVVAQDAIFAASDLATSVALWQMLRAPGANIQNIPLQSKAVTLSRTNLITYK